jgi:hypothetical protein
MKPTFPLTTAPNPRAQPQGLPQGLPQTSTPDLNPGLQPAQNAREKERRTFLHAWPEGAPRNVLYMTFTADYDEEKATRLFRDRHGADPEYIFETADALGMLWLGPIPPYTQEE